MDSALGSDPAQLIGPTCPLKSPRVSVRYHPTAQHPPGSTLTGVAVGTEVAMAAAALARPHAHLVLRTRGVAFAHRCKREGPELPRVQPPLYSLLSVFPSAAPVPRMPHSPIPHSSPCCLQPVQHVGSWELQAERGRLNPNLVLAGAPQQPPLCLGEIAIEALGAPGTVVGFRLGRVSANKKTQFQFPEIRHGGGRAQTTNNPNLQELSHPLYGSLHHPSHSLTLPCPPPLSTRTEKKDPMCPRKGSSEVGVGERSLDLLKLAPLGGGPARWVT